MISQLLRKTALLPLFLSLFIPGAHAAVADVRIAGSKISVHAEDVPLRDILQHLADRGVRVYMDPELNPKISASFKDRNMQDALESILKPFNHVLIWKTVSFAPEKSISAISEIRIFNPGRKEQAMPLGRDTVFQITGDKGRQYVKDEILIRPKPGMSNEEFDEFLILLEAIGGTVLEGNQSLGIYRIRLPENVDVPDLADRLAKHPAIAGAEPNRAFPLFSPHRSASDGQTGGQVSIPSGNASAVPIAILDTGLAANTGVNDLVLASLDALNPDHPISDTQGHGTQMALIASGAVRPTGDGSDTETACPIIPIRAFDENGVTSNFTIMRAVEFALDKGARVMSLSWGTETDSAFLKDAIDYADSKGMIIVAAAGNEPTGNPVFPAAYASVTGVGALAPDGKSWEQSNHGSFVSIYAPGFATLPVGYKGKPGQYAGTSISTAYAANLISRYLAENPSATREQVFDSLKKAIDESAP